MFNEINFLIILFYNKFNDWKVSNREEREKGYSKWMSKFIRHKKHKKIVKKEKNCRNDSNILDVNKTDGE